MRVGATLALGTLLFLLPFEPRRPTLALAGFQLTLLEGIAAAAIAALLWFGRDLVRERLRRTPPPLALLFGFAAAHLASAALAPANHGLAATFACRMGAAAVFALAVSAAPPEARRVGLAALAAGSSVVGLLAILEGAGVLSLDAFLDLFRPGPFVFLGVRRASGGSENPNLAAAFLVHGLVTTAGLAALRPRPMRLVVPAVALLGVGLLFTYSRGGLAASVAALSVLAASLGGRGRSRAAFAALAGLAASLALFAATSRVFWHRLDTERFASLYGARYEPSDTRLNLQPGETRRAFVRVTNTGGVTWNAGGPFRLNCYWHDARGGFVPDLCQARMPRAVAPGESVTLSARARAPDRQGHYFLVWDMVGEMGLFSAQGVPPATVPAVVAAETGLTASPPPGAFGSVWRRGRSELWRVAFAMWREHPVTGVGSDNFRWLHASYGGWSTEDPLTSANNTFLELAATTGSLGLLAFLATLASTARAALRALGPASAGEARVVAAIVLALTAGITAHAAIDYFLGFTGHYLFFGFLVGTAASLGAGVEPAPVPTSQD